MSSNDHDRITNSQDNVNKDTYLLDRPPQTLLNHNYSSSISSISSTTSSINSINSPPSKKISSGTINYSPKHSRKPNSFHLNRNMKNLSLNLNDSNHNQWQQQQLQNSQPSQNQVQQSMKQHTQTNSNSSFSSSNSNSNSFFKNSEGSPIKRSTITNNLINNSSLQTPFVTHTPTVPPKIPKAPDSIDSQQSYKFPPISNELGNLEENGYKQENNDLENFIPPIPPPFAFSNNSNKHYSPLSTPPILQSPVKKAFSSKSKTNSPLETNFSQNVKKNGNAKPVVEELQEKSLINAYPNGPRNVLNNLIYLYSDPNLSNIDLNAFNLVINVAKECKNLSKNHDNLEYLYLPWSHNSSISKDLLYLTEKIDYYYNQNLKILIHCQCGVSRSACVVVAYLMKKFKIDVNKAYEILKNGDSSLNIDKCDRICPNMSLIFELMEFNDILNNKEFTTQSILLNTPPKLNI
ncbi:unnamed protein product [Candida verbasci]|uniref:protein-tyrosine-phosphatase n=1 Tax=Candida verbasci TaxID=1227364 RepID=A0A9W4TWJ8_9ASCO|nr:unnamed protein product [Candida verbasci]